MTIHNLISFSGIFTLLIIAWIFSKNHKIINWRLIFWAIILQLLFGGFIFWNPAGIVFFEWVNTCIIKLLSFSKEGIYFLFGRLSIFPGKVGPHGEESLGFILAFQALPTIIFFSSLMSLLYFIKLMPKIIKIFSYAFTKLMRISGAESLCAASNIFVGIESAFSIKPFIEKMTKSELCTILTVGMATVASSVLAVYTGILKEQFPAIAGHLVSASILSAPAAIMLSKIIYPEDGEPVTLGKSVEGYYERPDSWIESIIQGANGGVKLIAGIVALLLAFLGLLAMANWAIGIFGELIGLAELSIQKILSILFYPILLLIGVVPGDAFNVATLLGERAIATEIVAYQHLAEYIKNGVFQDFRSQVIAAYALCGFAHIASLAIFVGGISALVPKRAKDLAQLGFRALFAATLACLMTAAVAGFFFNSATPSILLGR